MARKKPSNPFRQVAYAANDNGKGGLASRVGGQPKAIQINKAGTFPRIIHFNKNLDGKTRDYTAPGVAANDS